MRTEADVNKSSGSGGDYDVIFHLTLDTVQDLPIQERRVDLVVETFKDTGLLVCAISGFLSTSLPEWKAQHAKLNSLRVG